MELNEIGPLIGSSLKDGAEKLTDIYEEHAPRIWTGICIAAALFLPFTSSISMLKSIRLVEEEEKRLGRKLRKGEKFKLCWKCWIGTTVAVGITTGSAMMSLEESEKKIALMATGIQVLSEANKADILNTVEDVAGKKKRDEVNNKLTEKEFEKIPANVQHTRYGCDYWKEPLTGTIWVSDRNTVDRGVNYVNDRINRGWETVFGDWFESMNVECESALKDIRIDKPITLKEPGTCRTADDHPCNLITYYDLPFDRDSVMRMFNIRVWEE